MKIFAGKLIYCMTMVSVLFMASHSYALNYTYDSVNRLTKVVYDNGDSINYVYDAAGNITAVNASSRQPTASQDINGDGTVNLADALLTLRILTGQQISTAESLTLNLGSLYTGKISIGDAIMILHNIAGNTQPPSGGGTPTPDSSFQYSTEWLTGKTLYNTYYESDTSKWELATFVFASNNGSGTDSSKSGETLTFTYTITTDGILQLTFPDGHSEYIKAGLNTADYQQICWCDFIDKARACTGVGEKEYFYFDSIKANAFVTDKNNNLPNVNALVSGNVTFLGANEQVLPIPADALVAMTPSIYQNDAAHWTRLLCKVAADGSFGNDCTTDDPYAILAPFANKIETFQVAVIKNHIRPTRQQWDCGEDIYKYVSNNLPHSSLTDTIFVRPTEYQDRSAEQCGN